MEKRLRNITSLLLLAFFLLPGIIKSEHNNKHFYPEGKNKQETAMQDNCPICDFEFSIFIADFYSADLQNDTYEDNFLISYNSHYYSNLTHYSFSFRGPPEQQIS